MRNNKLARRSAVATAALAAAAALAACSSGSSSTAGSVSATTGAAPSASSSPSGAASGSGTASASVLTAAKAAETRPTKITITTPVGKTIPSGKTIDYVECTVPTCKVEADGFVSAAAVLGWKVKLLPAAATPQAIQAAFTQAIADHPDAVATIGYSNTTYMSQFRQLQAAHIPDISAFVTDTSTTDGPYVVTNGTSEAQYIGTTMGNVVAAGVKAGSHVLYVDVPAFPINVPIRATFQQALTAGCPSCTMSTLDIPAADLGATAAKDVANYVSGHPEINTVFGVLDDTNVGLRAALTQAGVTSPIALYGANADVPNLAYLKAGQETASFADPVVEVGWQMVDVLARVFVGVPYTASASAKSGVVWTQANVPSTTALSPGVAAYQQQYKALWGK